MFSVEVVAPGLVDSKSVFGLVQHHRATVFPPRSLDDMFADPIRGGRVSVPGLVVLSAVLLGALVNVSDWEVVECVTDDLCWKAACGVGVD